MSDPFRATQLPFDVPAWLHASNGPNTRELVQQPARFGLGLMPERAKPSGVTTVTCGFCSTGCGLNAHLQDGIAVNLSPTTQHPVNLGMACPKGWEALAVLNSPDRATTPLLREASGKLREVGWDQALRTFVERFKAIQTRHGEQSIAFLGTGQIATEEMALHGALFKFGMRGLHCDSNTRQCMATSHVAYKQSLGFDAPPFTYADFEESDLLIFVGGNPCIAHPIMWERVQRNPRSPHIVVLDPRRTETAMQAQEHWAIRPKSDLELLYSLSHVLVTNDWLDHEMIEQHTDNFAAYADFLRDYSPSRGAAASGIPEAQIIALAERIHNTKRVSCWWTMGVNQGHEAVRTAQAIINLCLMTGNIGRPGTGPNSITGQCNAMGSRIFANITSLYAGRDFASATDRQDVARLLNIDAGLIPSETSLPYHRIIEEIIAGRIKGLWVVATNPAHSWINQNCFKQVRDQLEFLVVQDMYTTTETAQHADLLLPAAGWGEKEGTIINSERRIGRIKKIARAPGLSLADFSIFQLIAEYWGCREMLSEWTSPAVALEILKRLSRGRPCDITGIDVALLDRCGGVQWPWPEQADANDPSQERRLFEDRQFFTANGRAKFIFDVPRPMPEPVDSEFSFVLLTGRGTVAQWHTNTRTAKSAILRKLYPSQCYAELHPLDAELLEVQAGDQLTIRSRRGSINARASLMPTVQRGQVFVPMHYESVNQLTLPVFDPHSHQPSYKACAVAVSKAVAAKKINRQRTHGGHRTQLERGAT